MTFRFKIFVSYLTICCYLFVWQNIIKAQQYNFKNYSVENGLPYIQIFALHQDNFGYLWSGGYGGASKFNGKVFQHYSPKNGLANHYVNCITENNNQQIIIGTIDGLSVIDNTNKVAIINYSTKNGLPSNKINASCFDNYSKIWLGTANGLCYLENNKIINVDTFKNAVINCLFQEGVNSLWIGTNNGLYNLTNNKLIFYNTVSGISNDQILCIAKNNITNELLIGTQNGLSILNLSTKKTLNYHINNGLLDETINAITCSETGVVWIGGKNGLLSFNGKEFDYFMIRQDNNSNNIISLIIDYEKNLWIGTHNGLFKFREKKFATFSKNDGLGGAFIYQIIEDKNKNLWLTTENNGIYKNENGYFKNYTTKNGLLNNSTRCILENEDGSLWLGTTLGISKLKNEKFENLTYGSTFKQQAPINCIFKDSKKNIWIGGINGVSCMKKLNASYLTSYFKLPTNIIDYEVWTINEDKNGTIWAGTYLAGLYKFNGNEFVKCNTSVKVESVLEIEFDSLNTLFGATLNGVLILNIKTNKSKLLTEKDGLTSELVYSLKISRDKKYLWAGTNQGTSKINLTNYSIISYTKIDGFEGVECNTHGIYEDSENNVWFGTVNGLIKFSPKEIVLNDNLSKTTISKFKLAFKDTILEDNCKLDYSNNNVTFYFDGISLTNPDKVLYTYKLEGFDNSWSPNTDINYIKYDNLPGGKYTFKVKSCNSEGIWNIEPVVFSFTIKLPYYKTWWFIIMLIITLSVLILLIFRIRLNQIRQKQKNEFENQIEISKSELKALRAQMNPHFVFNSLNSIQHFILNSNGEEAVKYLNKFAKLIRIILNNSEKTTVTINEELEAVTLYLELEKMRFNNKFEYIINVHPTVSVDYDEIPPMLIQPYLENAILHGINPKVGYGLIEICISIVNKFIKISIKDDGVGRKKAQSLKSLDPLARHKSFGMKITHERVRILNSIHNSKLNVNIIDLYNEYNEAIGTQVDLFIPYE